MMFSKGIVTYLLVFTAVRIGNAICSNSSATECFHGICSFLVQVEENVYQAICENGYCRCPGNSYYDECSCLPHVPSCLIERDSGSSVGTPTTDGERETTYSCEASDNCDYDVHVIGNYESSNGRHGFFIERQAGDTDVQLSVSGVSSRSLVLVLTSYEPVRWRLRVIPSSVVIDKVIMGSYYNSTVTAITGSIGEIETVSRTAGYGYGDDSGGGSTAKLLRYLVQRFGPISSFSGSYRADRWRLTIDRSTERCSELESPANGQVVVDTSSSQPIQAHYSCDTGYTLVGSTTRTCLTTGAWTGVKPICPWRIAEDDSDKVADLLPVIIVGSIIPLIAIVMMLVGLTRLAIPCSRHLEQPLQPQPTHQTAPEAIPLESTHHHTPSVSQQKSQPSSVSRMSNEPLSYSVMAEFSSVEPPLRTPLRIPPPYPTEDSPSIPH